MFVNGSITLSSLQKKEKCEKNHILGKFAWAEFLIFKTASGHSFEFFGKYLPLESDFIKCRNLTSPFPIKNP